jgi:hypothetical protein
MATVTGSRASPSTHRPLSSIFTNAPPGSILSGSPGSLGHAASPIATAAAVGRPCPPQPGGIQAVGTPGSLDRRSNPSSSIPTGTSTGSGHKRYSSTFGHRYSAGPSTPAAGQQQQQRQEAELQHFVSALDSHEPLHHGREATDSDVSGERALRGGAIRTGADNVKSELARMHEQFTASLEGLERTRDSGGNVSASPSPIGALLNSPVSSPAADTRFRLPEVQ